MTPFGDRLRQLRRARNLTQKDMARALNVSPAYLSALEHGHRSAPSFEFVQRVTGFLNVIWDDAEDLQRLAQMSDPRVTINTSGLAPNATELANLLARRITTLNDEDLNLLLKTLRR